MTPETTKPTNKIAEVRRLTDTGMSTSDARRTVRGSLPPSTISSTTLAPRAQASLATPVVPTEAPSLQADLQANSDDFTAKLEAQAKQAETANKGGLQSYIDQLSSSRGLTTRTADQYSQQGGVDTVATELNDINDQIRREQRANELAKRNITERGGGLAGGAQSELQNLERVSLQKQADLSIIQMAVQGRYDSAKTIADRAVSAQLEQQTNDLNIAKFNYDENKEMFTKAEQRAFESKVADRERTLETERQNKQDMYNLGLQASADGAPSSVVQQMFNAKTREEALALGGGYIGALDREAKRANIAQSYASIAATNTNRLLALAEAGDDNAIKSLGFDPKSIEVEIDPTTKRQLSDSVSAQESLLGLAAQYKDIVDTKGFTNTIAGDSATIGKVRSLRALMTAEYKKAAMLGTLDAGVLTLMDQILGSEPTSTWNPLINVTGRKGTALSAQLDTFIKQTESNKAKDMLRLGINPIQVDFSILGQDDDDEINDAFGVSNSTSSNFNPANYFK